MLTCTENENSHFFFDIFCGGKKKNVSENFPCFLFWKCFRESLIIPSGTLHIFSLLFVNCLNFLRTTIIGWLLVFSTVLNLVLEEWMLLNARKLSLPCYFTNREEMDSLEFLWENERMLTDSAFTLSMLPLLKLTKNQYLVIFLFCIN